MRPIKSMKKLAAFLVGVALVASVPLSAQGSLSNQVLRLLSRNNTWTGIQIMDPTVGLVLGTNGSNPTAGTTNTLYNKAGVLYWNGSAIVTASPGAGTVTSVGLAAPAILTVSGSPVTSSGTLTLALATQSANRVFAGPTSGGALAPTFRTLVAGDIPDISATYLTASSTATLTNKSGNISQWTNDSSYITASVATLSSLTSVGTIGTGTWHGTVIGAAYGGTGVNNSSNTITLGGAVTTASSFTTSGAFALTLTTTGATNVTLPTSGTLLSTGVTTLSSLASIGTITTGTWNATAIGAAYGGTGLASYTQGDILYASGATTLAKLGKNTTATRYLANTGGSNNPNWDLVNLTNGVTGTLPAANGGTGGTGTPTNGQVPIGNGANFVYATLTGTANQVTVTNGAGSITLATPQSIATTSTPQFARLGLGAAAGATAVLTTTGQFDMGVIDQGTQAAAVTFNFNNGTVQKVTLAGAPVVVSLTNPLTGHPQYTLYLIQDGTGNRTVTWPGSVTWKGGSAPTLTTGAGKTDIIYLKWNGTVYYGTSDLNF